MTPFSDPNTKTSLITSKEEWTRFNQTPNSLVVSSFELKRSWSRKEYLKTLNHLYIFSFLIWVEIKGSFFEHFISMPSDKKEVSLVQKWFFTATGGETGTFVGWLTFYSKLYIRNFIKYRINECRQTLTSNLSYFSALPYFEAISVRLFVLATFFASFQAFSLSQTPSPLLYIRKTTMAGYQELLPSPGRFHEAKWSLVPQSKQVQSLSPLSFNQISQFSEVLKNQLIASRQALKVQNLDHQMSFQSYLSTEYMAEYSRIINSINKGEGSRKSFKPIYDKFAPSTKNLYHSFTVEGGLDFQSKDSFYQKYNPHADFYSTSFETSDVVFDPIFAKASVRTSPFINTLSQYTFEEVKSIPLLYSKGVDSFHITQDPIYSFTTMKWLPVGKNRLNQSLTSYQNQMKKGNDLLPRSALTQKEGASVNHTVSSGLFWLDEVYPKKITNLCFYSSAIFTRFFIPLFSIYIFSIVFELFRSSNDDLESGVNSSITSSTKIIGSLANKKRLQNILGIEALLPDLEELLSDLRSVWKEGEGQPIKPKGYLFIGPPGTGKTKLAEAIAGEGQVTFIGISAAACLTSGSALNIRTLFHQARQLAPCILFIDEIDSFGLSRNDLLFSSGTRMQNEIPNPNNVGPGSVQKLQALTEFLVQMDGIESNSKIFVIGATNNRNLDPALIRPGRFDRSISFGLPSSQLRVEILKLHGKIKGCDPSIPWDQVAQLTTNLSGAYLEAIMNESFLKVLKESKPFHTFETIKHGIQRITTVSSLTSSRLTSIAKMQNPFYRLQPASSQTSKTIINLSVTNDLSPLGIPTNLELTPVSTLVVSDITSQELLERTNFKLLPLSTHLIYISYLLTSVISDYLVLSPIKLFKNRLFRWITPGRLDDTLQANNVIDYVLKNGAVFNSGSQSFFTNSKLTNFNSRRFTSSLPIGDSFVDFIDFKEKTTFISWGKFPIFVFNNALRDWSEQPSLKFDPNINWDLYYHQNLNLEVLSDSLKSKEIATQAILSQSQKEIFKVLTPYEFLYSYLLTLLLYREELLALQVDFILRKSLCDFYLQFDYLVAIAFTLTRLP